MNGASLAAVLGALDEIDDDLTIYAARPWHVASRAVVVNEPEDGSVPSEAAGMAYVLEVRLAREVIRVWSEWRGGATARDEDAVAAVLHYAQNDTYLPVKER